MAENLRSPAARPIARSVPVVPREMSAEERETLVDGLFEVYNEIFHGGTREFIAQGMVEPRSDFTTILLHRSTEGKLVGYFAIHFFNKTFRGVPSTVIRSSVGMLRAYRGRNANISWALEVLLKQRLAHPGRPFYGMGSMVHPSSYLQVARYVNEFWPRPGEPVPPDMLDFMAELADEFQMKRLDPQQPLVRKGTMPTRETEAERDYWQRSDKPAVRFYLSMNPTYSQGNGLLTLFPISASVLAGIGASIARDKARLLVEGAIATAQRIPLGGRLLGPAAVRRHLRAAPLFSTLDDESLRRVAGLSSVVNLPAGKTLIHEGDEGDDIFVIARGAVAVLARVGDREQMIDQLESGSLFGEIAALAGGRRKASIRTVIPTTLVQIPGEALRSAMKSVALGDAIWNVFTARIFDSHLRAAGRHAGLGRSQRIAWIQRARHAEYEPGACVPGDNAAFLIVLRGSVLLEQDSIQISARAPLVVEVSPSTSVTVQSRARIARVPPLDEPRAASLAPA